MTFKIYVLVVEYITSEPVEVLTTRLTILIEHLTCFDLALNLARVCKRFRKEDLPIDKHIFFDFYVGLLYKFKLVQEFYEEVKTDISKKLKTDRLFRFWMISLWRTV